jgi:hypothetical protein
MESYPAHGESLRTRHFGDQLIGQKESGFLLSSHHSKIITIIDFIYSYNSSQT